jgi:Clp amino terminal domain, pathogenicity island component
VDLNQLITAVEDDTSSDPLERVAAAAALKDQIEHIGDELLDHFVKDARDQGCSWTQIGEALGVTRQAAQQRHSGLLGRLLDGLKSGRFKRFTERARTAVIEAQSAARERNHDAIGTEHVLLGLARDEASVATLALARCGLDPPTIERLVDERVERGERPVRGHIRFTSPAKKAMELALREALALGHNYIGTEHIVLALRRTDEGLAAQILAEQGVSRDDLRAAVLDILEAGGAA